MKNRAQRGDVNILLIPLILAVLILIAAIGFGVWAYGGRQDYKNNTDQKVNAAVAVAKKQISADSDKKLAEDEKQPLKPYTGPSAYGSLKVKYPKTWSGYVAQSDGGQNVVDGYFYPGVVPSISDNDSTFALRVQITQTSYDNVLSNFTSEQQAGKVTIAPFKLKKVPGIVGVQISGEVVQNKTGSMIVLPLRDKTLMVWTESPQFENDFNKYILPNLSFSP